MIHNPTPLPHYPAEYIEGRVNFFGREFVVTPDVLIPRLETESLVRRARQILKTVSVIPGLTRNPAQPGSTGFLPAQEGQSKTIIVDIGCGSGIIGTSVADLADEVIFLDISPEALRIAEQNFRTHFPDKKARFIVSDLLGDCPHSYLIPHTSYLLLVNLPYIRSDDWEHMSPDTRHEPHLALFGGEQTGFELYERLFDQLSRIAPLIRGGVGFSAWKCLFEFGYDQRDIAEEILKKYPQWEYSFFADYAGVERFGEISL